MSEPEDDIRRYSAHRFAAGVMVCPSCLVHVPVQTDSCPSCRFTGGDTMAMFPLALPPLQPLLDAADLWTPRQQGKIRKRIRTAERRFPQIRWSLCSVNAGAVPNLRLFGFWMLNASPLAAGETAEQRAWTVLLLFNGSDGKVALVPGYGVETWVADDEWQRVLMEMAVPWSRGKRGRALRCFFSAAEESLRAAWKRAKHQLKRQSEP